jgi:hypothetical protein
MNFTVVSRATNGTSSLALLKVAALGDLKHAPLLDAARVLARTGADA